VPSTGTIYWQMNKGWPSLLWTLYNSDGDQAGSYFGAQQANQKLHAIYALANGTVTLDNLGAASQPGLSVESRVYNLAGDLLDDQQANNITLASQQVANSVLTPKVPAATVPPAPAQTYFVELLLRQNGTVVDRNVYWLSTQQDVTNWPKTLGQPQGSLSQYANLQALKTLPQTSVTATATTTHQAGPDGADLATVTITNTSAHPGRLLPARGRAPGHRGRNRARRGQRAAVLDLHRQRHHALARRVPDAHRHLQLGRSAGRHPRHQQLRMEQAEDRHCSTGTMTCPPRPGADTSDPAAAQTART
jgi:hypothetical protein